VTRTATLRQRARRWLQGRRQRRLERRGWYDPGAHSDAEAIFIGGCWRSGTSLLREILGRHPRLACGPESQLFALPFETARLERQWSADRAELEALARRCSHLVEFGDRFFARLLESEGAARWIDKSPQNARVARRLLEWFPRGRFLHVVRDGRDAVCSLRTYPRERFVGGRRVPAPTVDRPVDSCARTWVAETTAGLETRGHSRHLEVRYEDLVRQPEAEVRRICAFLGEDFAPAMLAALDPTAADSSDPVVSARFVNNPEAADAIHHASIGRWRKELTPHERRIVHENAGELLIELGYVEDDGWVEEPRDDSRP
jgi:hypothetical protein